MFFDTATPHPGTTEGDPMTLTGKVALVTGGGRGIGAAIARRLAALGAQTVICGRNPATLIGTARAIGAAGGKCLSLACDVRDYHSVQDVAVEVERLFGKLHVLVNNAGVGGLDGPLHEMPVQGWDDVLNTNLRGVFYCIRAFTPLLEQAGGGDIVNISSIAGKNALPNGAAYAASKWGLNGLSYSVAEELRGHKIRVSVICPGSTVSELSPHRGKDPARMLQPEDVAHVVEMLATQAPQSFASEVVLRPTQKP
jgi:NAD(P)-dependent dehydrogenase (short-subunit alcohol dehydrogenase family)